MLEFVSTSTHPQVFRVSKEGLATAIIIDHQTCELCDSCSFGQNQVTLCSDSAIRGKRSNLRDMCTAVNGTGSIEARV